MSLRSDVWFVTTLIGSTIRQILGEAFRHLADYLLHEDPKTESEPIKDQVQPAPTPVQRPSTPRMKVPKARTRLEVIHNDPLPEVSEEPEKPARVRDRSTYNPKEHNGYKIAAGCVLRTLIANEARMSAPALHKIHPNSTDSTIRTACKTMAKDGILATEYDGSVRSDVYWVFNREMAREHLAELEASAPSLPTSNEPGESETSLN